MRLVGFVVLVVCLGLFGWKIKQRLDVNGYFDSPLVAEELGESPDYVTDFQEAKRQSDATGKPLLLIFSASWCGPCQANKKRLYPHQNIQSYHDQFIWTYLDVDLAINSRLAAQYQVGSIPSIHVIGTEGQHLGSIGGAQSPQKFAAFLDGVLKQ